MFIINLHCIQVTRAFPEDNVMDTNNNKEDKDSEDASSVPWIDDTDKESSMSSWIDIVSWFIESLYMFNVYVMNVMSM